MVRVKFGAVAGLADTDRCGASSAGVSAISVNYWAASGCSAARIRKAFGARRYPISGEEEGQA